MYVFIYLFINIYSFLRDRVSGRRAEKETECEAGSRLEGVRTEPNVRLKPTSREIIAWAQVRCLMNLATQASLTHLFRCCTNPAVWISTVCVKKPGIWDAKWKFNHWSNVCHSFFFFFSLHDYFGILQPYFFFFWCWLLVAFSLQIFYVILISGLFIYITCLYVAHLYITSSLQCVCKFQEKLMSLGPELFAMN